MTKLKTLLVAFTLSALAPAAYALPNCGTGLFPCQGADGIVVGEDADAPGGTE